MTRKRSGKGGRGIFRAGCVSDGSFLRRRTQLFIAYLYKPEAQAKVLKIHVYYSHIIPSLALPRNTVKRIELRIRKVDIEVGARSKGSNGVVAVGLPHRNYSVFKQTPFQLRRSKRKNKKKEQGQHQRIDIRRSIKKVGLRALNKSGEG